MARNSEYQEKNKPILSILYVVAVIVLLVALLMMYLNYRERKRDYEKLVLEASTSDVNLDIETRRAISEPEQEPVKATAEPTKAPAPTATQAPVAKDEPLNAESGENEAAQQPGLPDLNVQNNAG